MKKKSLKELLEELNRNAVLFDCVKLLLECQECSTRDDLIHLICVHYGLNEEFIRSQENERKNS